MILILGFTGLLIVSFIVWLLIQREYGEAEVSGFICLCFFIIWLIPVAIVFPVGRMCLPADIIAIESVRDSIAEARNNPDISKMEVAAIQVKIIEINKEIATMQYWANNPLTNWYWTKGIRELKLIK